MFTLKSITSPVTSQPVRILCQNENGPCPLLAICNYLALHGDWTFPSSSNTIDLDGLTRSLANLFLEKVTDPEKVSEALVLLPTLASGLDLNVKFMGMNQFENTPQTRLFHSLNIPLIHGWLLDPEDKPTYEALHELSYNEAVVEMVQGTEKGSIIRSFFDSTSNQLSIMGLHSLSVTLKKGVYVFFWNNHFHVLYKKEVGEVFTLVTDQGYAHRSEIVWERLTGMDGDTIFVNNTFEVALITSSLPNSPGVQTPNQESQIDADYALALSLMEREHHLHSNSTLSMTTPPSSNPIPESYSSSSTKLKASKHKSSLCHIM